MKTKFPPGVMIYFLVAAFVLFPFLFGSCKKTCRQCDCTKNGQITTLENCAYGGGSSKKNLDTWEKYLEEEEGCEKLDCRDVK